MPSTCRSTQLIVVATKSSAQMVHLYRLPPLFMRAAHALPQAMEIHRPERAIEQSVPGLTGFSPDHPPVIGANRTVKSGVVHRAQHGAHVDVAVLRRMRGLVERSRAGASDVAAVREVNAPLRAESTDDA